MLLVVRETPSSSLVGLVQYKAVHADGSLHMGGRLKKHAWRHNEENGCTHSESTLLSLTREGTGGTRGATCKHVRIVMRSFR